MAVASVRALTSEVEPLGGGGRRDLDEVRVLEVAAPREVVHHRHLPRRRPLPLRAPRPPPLALHRPRRNAHLKCKIAGPASIRLAGSKSAPEGTRRASKEKGVWTLAAVPSIRRAAQNTRSWPELARRVPPKSGSFPASKKTAGRGYLRDDGSFREWRNHPARASRTCILVCFFEQSEESRAEREFYCHSKKKSVGAG